MVNQFQRLIVLSFSELVRQIIWGNITEVDLRDALFYFTSGRVNVFNPPLVNEIGMYQPRSTEPKQLLISGVITRNIIKAEQTGRIFWNTEDNRLNFNTLNKLLDTNGFPLVSTNTRYSCSAAKEAIESQTTLRVIY